MKKLLLILLFGPLVAYPQWENRYKQGIYFEKGGFSKGSGINYYRIFSIQPKSFIFGSIGFSEVLGSISVPKKPNNYVFESDGYGIPLLVSYNYFLGNLEQKAIELFNNSCYKKYPKFKLDWFGEAGGGIVTSFHSPKSSTKTLIVPQIYLGLRIQKNISRPKKNNDIIFFIRGGTTPYYYQERIHTSTYGSYSASIGVGF